MTTIRSVRPCRLPPVFATLAFLLAVLDASAVPAQAEFVRGDVNLDGRVSISDTESWICIFFCDFFPTPCQDAADVDDNGYVDIADMIHGLQVIFTDLPDSDGSMPGGIAAPYPQPGLDPTEDNLSCESYEVTEPLESDEVVSIDHVRAAPGELVRVPVRISVDAICAGVQLAVRYEPDLFTPIDIEGLEPQTRSELIFGNTIFAADDPDQLRWHFIANRLFPGEAVLWLAHEFDLLSPIGNVQPGEDLHIFNIPGVVSPGAGRGDRIALEIVEHTAEDGTLLRPELSGEWAARLPRTLRDGSISIAEPFVRGDGNVDGRVDVSDSIHILNGLFVGNAVIDCLDSADTNDDSHVDLSDAISLLEHLFLGGPTPGTPHPDCGVDPSDDALDCVSYPPCP